MTSVAGLEREVDRLAALRSGDIIDTQPEADFDDLVAVASVIAEAPQACIAFVDETRWWVKAWVGQGARELPRVSVLCAESIVSAEPMVVDDVRAEFSGGVADGVEFRCGLATSAGDAGGLRTCVPADRTHGRGPILLSAGCGLWGRRFGGPFLCGLELRRD